VRIVGGLDTAEAFEIPAVGLGGADLVVIGQLEVDIVSTGGERPDGLPRVSDLGHVNVGTRVSGPGAGEAGDVAGVAVSDRAVVGREFIGGAADVEDD